MKILMIIAKHGFRDEEYLIPFNHFKSKQIAVDTASTEKGECTGRLGAVINANISFEEVNIQDYFAIALIGGPGSKTLVGNQQLEKILQDSFKNNLIVAAICYAPVILAKAGFLKGKKATVWDGDGLQSRLFDELGISFIDQPVVRVDNVITANGPDAAQEFAEEVLKAVQNNLSQ